MKLTDLLRRTAEANPQAATLHSIADKAEELVEKRYSVRRMLREMGNHSIFRLDISC